MSERDVLFPVLCGFGPKRHLHFAHYGIGQHILHLCGGSIADLVVKAAGAAAVAHHRVGAVGHITHLAKARQLGTDGLAVTLIFRFLDELYFPSYLERGGAKSDFLFPARFFRQGQHSIFRFPYGRPAGDDFAQVP